MKEGQKKQAQEIFKDLPEQKELFLNSKGEFFTNENYCKNSVKKDSEYSTIKRSDVASEDAKNETTGNALTVEDLKAKGEGLKEFLNDMRRGDLNALDSLFEFSIAELPNKTECVEQIVKALAK